MPAAGPVPPPADGAGAVSTGVVSAPDESGLDGSAQRGGGGRPVEASPSAAARSSPAPGEEDDEAQGRPSSGAKESARAASTSRTSASARAKRPGGRPALAPASTPAPARRLSDSSPSPQSSEESRSTASEETGVDSPRRGSSGGSRTIASQSPPSSASPGSGKAGGNNGGTSGAKKPPATGPSAAVASDAAKVLVRLRLAPRPPPPPSGRGRTRNCWQPLGGGKYAMVLTRQHFPGRIILPSRSAADVGAEIFGKEWCEFVASMSDELSSKVRLAVLREEDRDFDWGVNYRIFHKTPGQPIYISGGVAKLFSARGAAPYWVVTLAPCEPGVAAVTVLPPRDKLAARVLAQLGFTDELPALPPQPPRPASPLPAKREREDDLETPQNEDEEVAVASMRSLSMAVVQDRSETPDARGGGAKAAAAAASPRKRSASPRKRSASPESVEVAAESHGPASPPRAKVERRESTASPGRAVSDLEASEPPSEAAGPGTPAKLEPPAEPSEPSALGSVEVAPAAGGSASPEGPAPPSPSPPAERPPSRTEASGADATARAPSTSTQGSSPPEESGQKPSPTPERSVAASPSVAEPRPSAEPPVEKRTPTPESSSAAAQPRVPDLPVLTEPAWPDGKTVLTAAPAGPSPARKGRFDPTEDAFLTREQRAAKRAAAMQERMSRDEGIAEDPPRLRSLRHRRKSGAAGEVRGARPAARSVAGSPAPATRIEAIGSRPGSFSEIEDFDKIPSETWKMLLPLSRAPDEGPATPSSQPGAPSAPTTAASAAAEESVDPSDSLQIDAERPHDASIGRETAHATPMAIDL